MPNDVDYEKITLEEEELTKINDKELEIYLSDNALKDFLRTIKKHKIPTNEENLELIKKFQNGDIESRNLLIEKNLRLVVAIAFRDKHKLKSYDKLDVIQDGILGLMRGIEMFDITKGCKFSTYVFHWIKQNIGRGIDNFDSNIRIPVNLKLKISKYNQITTECLKNNRKLPTDSEWLDILETTKDTLKSIKEASKYNTDSLNRIVDNKDSDSDTEIVDFIEIEETGYNKLLNDMVDNELKLFLKLLLKPNYYYVLYYMVLNADKKRLEDVAKIFDISRERIRQIEIKSLGIAKRYYQNKNFSVSKYLREKNIQNVDNYNVEPLNPFNFTKYLYVKDYLTKEEQLILKNYFFSLEKITTNKEFLIKTLEKVKEIITKEKTLYQEFHTNLIKEYGLKIFQIDLELDVKKFKNTPKKTLKDTYYHWQSKTYQDLLNILVTLNLEIPKELEKKINLFFNNITSNYNHPSSLEKILNKIILYNDNDYVKDTILYKYFKENQAKFSDIEKQVLNVHFGKISKKDFDTLNLGNYYKLKEHIMLKLNTAYFGYKSYRNYNFNREKYLSIRNTVLTKIDSYSIYILDNFFGYETGQNITQEQLAEILGLSLKDTKIKLRNAKLQAGNVLAEINNNITLDMKIYKNYLENNLLTFASPTKEIISDYIFNGKTYQEIALKLNLSTLQVSNYLTDALWKIDNYRFGILKTFAYPVEALKEALEKTNFTSLEKEAFSLYLKTNDSSIVCQKYNLPSSKFQTLYGKLKYHCLNTLTSDVTLTKQEIIAFINYPDYKNVLSLNELSYLSLVYGIKNNYNLEGELLPPEELAKRLKKTKSYVTGAIEFALKKLKIAKKGLLKGPYDFIEIEDLKNILNDVHTPISEEDRYILRNIYNLDNENKTFKELADYFNMNEKSFLRKFERIIVIIKRYQNKEISGVISYETDVVPLLKYFTKSDQEILKLYYKDKLTYKDIAKKYNLTFDQSRAITNRLRIYLKDLQINPSGFDFDYFWEHINDNDIPLYGNKELAIKLFKLYYEDRIGANELAKMFNVDINCIRRIILVTTLAISKRQIGIKKIRDFSLTEVETHFHKFKTKMPKNILKSYEKYLSIMNNPNFVTTSCPMSDMVANDLLRYSSNYIKLAEINREDLKELIMQNKAKLTEKELLGFLNYLNISPREIMNGKDKNQVLSFLMNIEEKLEFQTSQDLIKKRSLNNL